eukprot:7384028-Prymnesium_polylepis.1
MRTQRAPTRPQRSTKKPSARSSGTVSTWHVSGRTTRPASLSKEQARRKLEMAVTEWIHPCRPKGKVYDTGDGKVNELRAVFNQRGGNVSSRCFCMMDKPKKE